MFEGVSKYVKVHEFDGEIFDYPASFRVTSVTGHVFVTDFPDEYQDWRKVNPQDLFDAPTIKKEANTEVN